jgi:hypothetical protein
VSSRRAAGYRLQLSPHLVSTAPVTFALGCYGVEQRPALTGACATIKPQTTHMGVNFAVTS